MLSSSSKSAILYIKLNFVLKCIELMRFRSKKSGTSVHFFCFRCVEEKLDNVIRNPSNYLEKDLRGCLAYIAMVNLRTKASSPLTLSKFCSKWSYTHFLHSFSHCFHSRFLLQRVKNSSLKNRSNESFYCLQMDKEE